MIAVQTILAKNAQKGNKIGGHTMLADSGTVFSPSELG
jgi:hypothetical protein